MTQAVCNVCVMDATDPDISFLQEGCSHCAHARRRVREEVFAGEKLEALVARIKEKGRNKPYDCLVGLSGGVDSSWLLVKARDLGLRPLALHLDNGWNSELAIHNIDRLIHALKVDLMTYVIDWEEVRALQRACFRAPLMDIEIVSDHAIFASLFHTAASHGISYIISGSNVATESILPLSWVYDKRDGRHVRAVYRRHGEGLGLRSYPLLLPARFLYYVFVKGIRTIPLLNYLDYRKPQVIKELSQRFGWRPYPGKHGESTFTRFFQDYYLYAKFGIDKRKAHLSSQIVSGQITRDEALAILQNPPIPPDTLRQEKEYVLKKLGFAEDEFDDIMRRPAVPHRRFANNAWMFDLRNPLTRFIRRVAQGEA